MSRIALVLAAAAMLLGGLLCLASPVLFIRGLVHHGGPGWTPFAAAALGAALEVAALAWLHARRHI